MGPWGHSKHLSGRIVPGVWVQDCSSAADTDLWPPYGGRGCRPPPPAHGGSTSMEYWLTLRSVSLLVCQDQLWPCHRSAWTVTHIHVKQCVCFYWSMCLLFVYFLPIWLFIKDLSSVELGLSSTLQVTWRQLSQWNGNWTNSSIVVRYSWKLWKTASKRTLRVRR